MPRHPEGEPEYTIYGQRWDAARGTVEALGVDDLRRAVLALMDYIEAGWDLIRPLQLGAQAITKEWIAWCREHGTDAEYPAAWVAGYVDLMVTDEFRGIAIHCPDELRGGDVRTLWQYDFKGEAETVQRALRILGMAASSPDFPAVLKGPAVDAARRFERWTDGLRAVLVPLAAEGAPVEEG